MHLLPIYLFTSILYFSTISKAMAFCEDATKNMTSQWNVSLGEKEFLVTNSLDQTVWKAPTSNLGEWVLFEQNNDSIILTKKFQHFIQSTMLDSNCALNVSIIPILKVQSKIQFLDEELENEIQRLSKDEILVIYTWSPRMNLSVRGLQEISAVKFNNAKVIVLVDPSPEKKLVESTLSKKGLSHESGRILASTELIQRHALLHFPSYITYTKKDGFKTILGYLTPENYKDLGLK